MTGSTLQTALVGISAAREYVPNHVVVVAASQAKTFATEQVPKAAGAIVNSARENPGATAGVILATTGLAIVAAPAVVSAPTLLVSGFGSTGVGAGTTAAGAQSSIGNVVAGSVFSTLQSAGTGGAGLAVVNGVYSLVVA
ncbi:uncharacterized protein K441DRAFT_671561 [Cenococcum geophilum 1.58]|uniref:Uncharacterized protein n=1 Tax=Cenococcum geophilum 1.58 TaxID=794803 RepID=A0ACC8EL02_9PEZI|nr:hypothetical protein K441DRAFT_671561 [Cenococcum geophilum 1.58]